MESVRQILETMKRAVVAPSGSIVRPVAGATGTTGALGGGGGTRAQASTGVVAPGVAPGGARDGPSPSIASVAGAPAPATDTSGRGAKCDASAMERGQGVGAAFAKKTCIEGGVPASDGAGA